MIFLDSDVLSYYFSGDTKIHDKIKETIDTGEKIALNDGKLISNNIKHYKDIRKLELLDWLG